MTDPTAATSLTVSVRVLEGHTVHTLGRSYGGGQAFIAAAEQARRLVELTAVEIIPTPTVPTPEPVAVDHVEVRIPGGFRSLPRDEARALIAAGEATAFYPAL